MTRAADIFSASVSRVKCVLGVPQRQAWVAVSAGGAALAIERVTGNEAALSRSKTGHPAVVPVRAVGLGVTIEDRPILQGVELEIPAGQFIALLGANGAGKSTLLKILATLLAPSTGTLELFGLALKSSGVAIRRRIGLIGHQSMLYHDLSAVENLEFFGKLYGVKDARGRALELLGQLGLAARAKDAVKGFSRGMAQRVSIARALLHDPELLLADEPFAGLDAPSMALLEKTLAGLHAAGKTIILANHDIRQSLALAQRAVVLARGQKVLDAAAEGLDAATVLAHMQGGPAAGRGGAMNALQQIGTLVAKDLRIEGRTRTTIGLVLVLGVLIVSVLGLGFSSHPEMAKVGTPAILWVAYLFAGVLCFEKTMAVERQDGALAGLLLAPIDRGVIYAAKLASNLILMFGVAAVITPVGILFFGFDLSPAPGGFVLVIATSMVGFAAIGTLFAALVSSTRLAGGLLALLIFPVVLPLVIASTQMITAMFDGRSPDTTAVAILVAFDAIFLAASWIVFEIVLEP